MRKQSGEEERESFSPFLFFRESIEPPRAKKGKGWMLVLTECLLLPPPPAHISDVSRRVKAKFEKEEGWQYLRSNDKKEEGI